MSWGVGEVYNTGVGILSMPGSQETVYLFVEEDIGGVGD